MADEAITYYISSEENVFRETLSVLIKFLLALTCVWLSSSSSSRKTKIIKNISTSHTMLCNCCTHAAAVSERKQIYWQRKWENFHEQLAKGKQTSAVFLFSSLDLFSEKEKDHTGKRQRRKTRSRVRAIKTRTSGQHGKAQRDSLTKRAQEMRWWWKTMKRENLEQDHFVLHSHYGTRPRWCVV